MSASLVPRAAREQLAVEAVASLRQFFGRGHTRELLWRREQLLRLRAMLVQNEELLLEALRADLGKSRIEAYLTELGFVVSECDRALRQLRRWVRPERVPTPLALQPGRSEIVREPLGVVLVIAPWNYPVQLLLSPLVGALAAGNAVVLKPSEVSEHTSEVLEKLIPRYLDPEAVRVVSGGPETSRALLTQPFDHIFFTGSGATAREVMRAAAENLTPVTLELGGKSPCIVDASADLEVTARRIAWGKYLNAGQTCVAPDYALVPEDRVDAFVAALERAVLRFYGRDPRSSLDFGRIIHARHHARLMRMLEGFEPAFGGLGDAAELYLAPTALCVSDDAAPVLEEEIFGPILAIRPVPDLEAALHYVNARPKPLALYVFAEDPSIQRSVLERTSAGGVGINATLFHLANPSLPFGGVGPSGQGAYHGHASFETFSHRKSVYARSTWFDPRILYPPYGSFKARWLRHFS